MTPFHRLKGKSVSTLAKLALTILLIASLPNHTYAEGEPPMKVRDLYPLVTTPNLAETRDFYVTHFGFDVAFEASWFIYLVGPAEEDSRGATLAFMHPDHPSTPP